MTRRDIPNGQDGNGSGFRLPTTGRLTWLEISPPRVVANYRRAQRAVGSGTAIFPVVKADGYGLGAIPISRALMEAGAPGLCVGLVEEGAALRAAGIDLPLVLFSGLRPGVESAILELDLWPFLYDFPSARRLHEAALAVGRVVSCFIKVDTGMGRLGFSADTLSETLPALQALSALRPLGLVSHLACGDEGEGGQATRRQVARMAAILQQSATWFPEARAHSLANSAGILYHPASHWDWVRPGIMLYGASPAYPQCRAEEEGLVSVVRWVSHILQIRAVPAGTPLGYGHAFVTERNSRIAQIPVGYGDGYLRCLSHRGHMLIRGRKAPVVGRVCMDLTMLDVTDIPEAEVGGRVTLLGEEEGAAISIEEMACWMETIPYEVICLLGRRLPRYAVDF